MLSHVLNVVCSVLAFKPGQVVQHAALLAHSVTLLRRREWFRLSLLWRKGLTGLQCLVSEQVPQEGLVLEPQREAAAAAVESSAGEVGGKLTAAVRIAVEVVVKMALVGALLIRIKLAAATVTIAVKMAVEGALLFNTQLVADAAMEMTAEIHQAFAICTLPVAVAAMNAVIVVVVVIVVAGVPEVQLAGVQVAVSLAGSGAEAALQQL
mmetsp:Transcript_28291/g.38948  ORF Transcript_28291/g.38948 Transcript_28291/m.38948 type:complete len:209 (+) Transcript_28291:80-706(+)|eukprot:CAMPEP_0170058784 /NCGR_PEP_ID=MMETSP0019_2-20121128/1277_1 /TAXON_ID=98059 /ORGANISM="Dinobryon sp., Strain UTEXLB2267" /LENGTH=208 /DNA_ID=CAMNT_0010263811 /DNA_START=63 /DNA_END=689 /DNA_ORIENTATION=-